MDVFYLHVNLLNLLFSTDVVPFLALFYWIIPLHEVRLVLIFSIYYPVLPSASLFVLVRLALVSYYPELIKSIPPHIKSALI